ncbi:hypothetical protein KKC91_04335 [bacterium]|nr:hypothetical protein [bacterium]MBU1853682.1 hypothetical protein [Candidatus Omnitrophota bacterium]
MKHLFLKLSLLIFLITPLSSYAALQYHDAKVADISDRSYEPAVIELLDNAKESILISMYVISPLTEPINLLLNDLAEALERGVKVEIYLNTRFETDDHSKLTMDFKGLEQKGARIYLASPHYRLHDKLIIVDGMFVVEGSANWSVSALKANYESATIIDSPDLAQEKTIRIRNFLLAGMEGERGDTERIDRPKIKTELPDTIEIPYVLLEEKKYFPTMRKWGDNRSISAYLLLIRESARIGKNEFFLDLEDFAAELQMPKDWSDTAKRRQVIKTLKKLSTKYELITATFTHGKDAYIKLTELPGDTFTLKSSILAPDFLAKTTPTAKTVLLIDVLLKDEGLSREDFSKEALQKRFSTTPKQFRKGMKELESIEVE